jgi:hypothetical protein
MLALIGYVVYHYTSAGVWDILHVVAVAGLLLVDSLVGWVAFVVITPPAEWVEVDQKGVRMGYESGRILGRDWSDEDIILRLYRTDGTSDWISKGRPAFAFTVDREPFRAFLTPQAAETIRRAGLEHGLITSDIPCTRKGWKREDLSRPNLLVTSDSPGPN